MVSPLTDKLIKQLKKSNLSMEDRLTLITALLDKLGTLPIGDIVHFTENGLMINGKELDQEQMLSFREAVVALKENFARNVINEQVRWKAIDLGINQATAIDTLFFSKAALWCQNEENILIEKLLTLG